MPSSSVARALSAPPIAGQFCDLGATMTATGVNGANRVLGFRRQRPPSACQSPPQGSVKCLAAAMSPSREAGRWLLASGESPPTAANFLGSLAVSLRQASMALQVNSVPLSETIESDLLRRSTIIISSQATRRPEIDVSRTAPRHSLVISSTTLRTRKRRPLPRRCSSHDQQRL